MGRARKPGTRGKTTIPPEVVKAVTKRLRDAFNASPEVEVSGLELMAQQHYLYLETRDRPQEILAGLVEARLVRKRRRPAVPLGRMVWTGDAERWHLELYKWSDDWWDEENDASTAGGTPEECLAEAVLGWDKFT